MFIDKESNINLKLGNKYKYISSIILNNGKKIINMQCSLIEDVPTQEQLQRFEDKEARNFEIDLDKEIERLEKLYDKFGLKGGNKYV